jgi:hypothetical protein
VLWHKSARFFLVGSRDSGLSLRSNPGLKLANAFGVILTDPGAAAADDDPLVINLAQSDVLTAGG